MKIGSVLVWDGKYPLPEDSSDILKELSHHLYPDSSGASVTFGELYHKKYPQVPAGDWMKFTSNISRQKQIEKGLMDSFDDVLVDQTKIIQKIRGKFRVFPDFPGTCNRGREKAKTGIQFLDWSNLLLRYNYSIISSGI